MVINSKLNIKVIKTSTHYLKSRILHKMGILFTKLKAIFNKWQPTLAKGSRVNRRLKSDNFQASSEVTITFKVVISKVLTTKIVPSIVKWHNRRRRVVNSIISLHRIKWKRSLMQDRVAQQVVHKANSTSQTNLPLAKMLAVSFNEITYRKARQKVILDKQLLLVSIWMLLKWITLIKRKLQINSIIKICNNSTWQKTR